MITDSWPSVLSEEERARLYDVICNYLLNPEEEITGYLEIKLMDGGVEEFTLRIDDSKEMKRMRYIQFLKSLK